MSEPIALEVHMGDTIFVCRADGHCNLHYVEHGGHLEFMLQGFEQFLRGAGFNFDGNLSLVDEYEETQWAVDVRNFLDRLTDPEAYGLLFMGQAGKEVVEEARKLRDEF